MYGTVVQYVFCNSCVTAWRRLFYHEKDNTDFYVVQYVVASTLLYCTSIRYSYLLVRNTKTEVAPVDVDGGASLSALLYAQWHPTTGQ